MSVSRRSTSQGKSLGLDKPDKDDVSFCDMLVRVCGEEQVAAPGCPHHIIQSRLINGQLLHSHKCLCEISSQAIAILPHSSTCILEPCCCNASLLLPCLVSTAEAGTAFACPLLLSGILSCMHSTSICPAATWKERPSRDSLRNTQ